MGKRVDAYAVLQVVPTAHQDVVRAAYRALARRYHPDQATDDADARRMVELNAAWDLVGDPARRAAYDLAAALEAAKEAEKQAAREAAGPSTAATPPSAAPAKSNGRRTTKRGRAESAAQFEPEPAPASTAGPEPARPVRDEPPSPWRREAPGPDMPPPGQAFGSVLDFGRYRGWSLGQIARVDPDYLEWFKRTLVGRRFTGEIEAILAPYAAAPPAAAAADRVTTPLRGRRFFGRR